MTLDNYALLGFFIMCLAFIYGLINKIAAKIYLFVVSFIFLGLGVGVLYFIWTYVTNYDSENVYILIERKKEWEYLSSGHIDPLKYKVGDLLEVYSRADFELKLEIPQKQAYLDSVMKIGGFNKYIQRTVPKDPAVIKRMGTLQKRREAANLKYTTIEPGCYFEVDNFHPDKAYQFKFLKPVNSVMIKAHKDSIVAYNTILANYRGEKFAARSIGVIIFFILLGLSVKEFRAGIREPKDTFWKDGKMNEEKEDDVVYVPVPGSEQRLGVPKSFDLERIRNDLLKYRGNFDTPLAKLYISTLITVFKHNQQRKALRELIKNMNLGVEYIKALKSLRDAETEYNGVGYDIEISEAEKQLRLAQLQSEKKLLEKRTEKEIRDLEAEEEERRKQVQPSSPKKSDYEILLDRLDKEHQISIRRMQSLKDKLLMTVQICDQIKKERPEDGEIICEDLLRLWHENGILDSNH